MKLKHYALAKLSKYIVEPHTNLCAQFLYVFFRSLARSSEN